MTSKLQPSCRPENMVIRTDKIKRGKRKNATNVVDNIKKMRKQFKKL